MPRQPMDTEWKQFIRSFKQNKCEICDKHNSTSLEKRLQIHHKKPVREGGTDELGNLMLLCPTCHQIEEGKVYALAHIFRDALIGSRVFTD